MLLAELKEYMSVSKERYADAGTTAAKFVETLQRSNEQLVKLATIMYKKESAKDNFALSDDDKNELFDLIKEDKSDKKKH